MRIDRKDKRMDSKSIYDMLASIDIPILLQSITIIVMGFIAAVTTYYAIKTRDLWKINKRLWELSRDTSLCNYAINYLTSFVKNLRKDELRGVYTTTARRTIYDALEELLSPETAKEVKRFRGIVDAQLTEEILKIKTELKKQK